MREKAEKKVTRLFVYGTLKPGEPNAHELAGIEGTWQQASVRGILYASGWGAALGYPGLVLDEAGKRVPGMLLTSDQLHAHWERLDDFEGEGYERVPARVLLEDGTRVTAQVYQLRDKNPPG